MGPYFASRSRRILRAISDKIARESGQARPTMPKPLKLTTSFADAFSFDLGGRRFELLSPPSGETLNAICIWLPAQKILFTGNFFSAVFGTMPNFYTLRGDRQRSVPGWLGECRRLIDLQPALLITGHVREACLPENQRGDRHPCAPLEPGHHYGQRGHMALVRAW